MRLTACARCRHRTDHDGVRADGDRIRFRSKETRDWASCCPRPFGDVLSPRLVFWWLAMAVLILPERRGRSGHAATAPRSITLWWGLLRYRIAPVDVKVGGFLCGVPLRDVTFLTTGVYHSRSPPVGRAVAGCAAFAIVVRRAAGACLVGAFVFALSVLDGFADRYWSSSLQESRWRWRALRCSNRWSSDASWSLSPTPPSISSPRPSYLLAAFDWHMLAPPLSGHARRHIAGRVAFQSAQAGEVLTNDNLLGVQCGRAGIGVSNPPGSRKYRLRRRTAREVNKEQRSSRVRRLEERVALCAKNNRCLFAVFRTGRFPFEAFSLPDMMRAFDGAEIGRSDSMTLVRYVVPAGSLTR